MKKFFLLLALIYALQGGLASAAPDAEPPASPDSDPAAESTPPPAPSDPAALANKFGKDWSTTKQNEDMLKDESLVNEETKEGNLSQEDSYIMVSNVLYGCVETSASGRTDDACKDDPSHPECVGIAGALKNATNCLEYFTPATLGCKVYGTSEYGMDEWVAVGDQFQTQMVSCANSKQAFDDKKNGASLENLTELIGAGNFLSTAPGAPTLTGALLAPKSTVSGNIKPDMDVSTLDWESLSRRIKDGASYLGYQDGDILRASLKGESFSSIVTGSPFAQNLNYVNKAKLEEGLADSAMIAKRVTQSYRESKGEGSGGGIAATPENPGGSIAIGGSAGGGQSSSPQNATADGTIVVNQSVLEPGKAGSASAGADNPAAQAAAAASKAEIRRWLESERIEAVARAAALARSEKKPYRAPSSVNVSNSKAEDLVDTTLFQRVSLAYRRRSPGMRSLESRNGDLIRSIERPEIFRNL